MSLVGFWSIALLYSNTGQHHLLQAPIPNWLKVISIVGSVGLIIPVFSFSVNIYMTMRGQWGQMLENIPLRFVLTGTFFYLAVSFQGSVQALMAVNRFVHFHAVGHRAFASGVFGRVCVYLIGDHALHGSADCPQAPLEPQPGGHAVLADADRGQRLFLGADGGGAGAGQRLDHAGRAEVVKAYPIVKPYFLLRTVFGGMFAIGATMQLINLVMTIRQKMPTSAQIRNREIAALQELSAPASEF